MIRSERSRVFDRRFLGGILPGRDPSLLLLAGKELLFRFAPLSLGEGPGVRPAAGYPLRPLTPLHVLPGSSGSCVSDRSEKPTARRNDEARICSEERDPRLCEGHAQNLLIFLIGILLPSLIVAQNGWLPASREVERLYGASLYDVKSSMHTSIRPYRLREVLANTPNDTLLRSALPVLDRWASRNDRNFRWGPLVDASLGVQGGNKDALFHRAGAGLWVDADAGSDWNFHFDGQLWNQRFPDYLDRFVQATQVTPGEGYAFGDRPNYTHFDWNAYVSWDPGKYFNLTLGRGKNFFGEGHRSLMLSTEAQGYPYLRITTTIWKVKYVNLFTLMNDIRFAGGDPGDFRKKFAAIHYFSWNAHPRINLSIFEAIMFDQGNEAYPRGFDLNYVNPIIFYRPVEFNQGSPDNALLGASLNVKAGRNTTIYSQFVLDEFLMFHVRYGTGWYANKQALQLGAIARNAFKIDGLTLRGEWNYVRPFMYTHINNFQNYAHFGQPLAHPHGSNVHEVIAHVELEQERLLYGVRASMAWLGADSVDSYGNNIFRPDTDRPRHPAGNPINFGYYHGDHTSYTLVHAELRAGYLLDRNSATRLEASYMFRYRSPLGGISAMSNIFRIGISCYFRDRHPEQAVRYFLE